MEPIQIPRVRKLSKNYNYHTSGKNTPPRSKKKVWKWILLIFVVFGLLTVAWGMVWMNNHVYKNLPDLSELKDLSFSQSTIITDRNGIELYRLFDENREYVPYEAINSHMIDAIVAIEDQRYWEHNGLDTIGIFRAAIHNVLNPGGKLQGASTIPQQFVKNLLLSSDQKLERKIKEIILTKKLDKVITNEIRRGRHLSDSEVFKKKKEKILELYLNYIPFGNNAFGVEAASKTYFAKSAKDLSILESAILGSLPKSATLFNPYTNRVNLMGEIKVMDINGENHFNDPEIKKVILDKIKTIINSADFARQDTANKFVRYVEGLLSFQLEKNGINYTISYKYGRKDLGLGSMFEQGYITADELKKNFFDSLDFTFKKGGFQIKAPHFVMMVKKILEEKYTEEQIQEGGLTVRTSLDYNIQKIAEDAITTSKEKVLSHGANNQAMMYINSTNGDILAYVGSIDYFNTEMQGQNDMIQAKRQVGSTLKPFAYALGLEKLPIGLETPLYDIPMHIGKFSPNNADNKFLGILPFKKALAYSRNIPAIKMFFAIGGEQVFKPFLQSLGITSLKNNIDYGFSMVLGAAETSMWELGSAYTHLSNAKPATLDPILDIKKKDGSFLYKKTPIVKVNPISLGARYLTWHILSDYSNMPPSWAGAFIVRNLTLAIKSGTSDAKTSKGNRPRDGWLISYTPTRVALFWAGNTDGKPLYRSGYGGTMNSSAMRNFWNTLVKENQVKSEGISQIEVKTENISKINGKLVGDSTPPNFVVSSLEYAKSPPNTVDPGMSTLQFDTKCYGAISPFTPQNRVKDGYVITPISFMPNGMDVEAITQWWNWSTKQVKTPDTYTGKVIFNYDTIFVQSPKETCDNIVANNDENIEIKITNISANQKISKNPKIVFSTTSPSPIRTISFMLDNEIISTYRYYENDTTIATVKNISLEKYRTGKHLLSLFVLNNDGKSNQISLEIYLVEKDTTPPTLNKGKIVITKDAEKGYNITLLFDDDLSGVEGGSIMQHGKSIATFDNVIANFFIQELGPIDITAKDSYANILKETINLQDYYSN